MEVAGAYGLRLACEIVRDHFGEDVEKTCAVLLAKGRLTLNDLLAQTQLPYAELRNHLLVLMQQNIVFATSENSNLDDDEEGPANTAPQTKAAVREKKQQAKVAAKKWDTGPMPVRYEASLEAIILRLRYSKFSIHIQDKFGDCAQLLFEEILEHGRLTADQCTSQALAVYQQNAREHEPAKTQEDFATLMVKLIRERYVDRVRPRTNVPVPSSATQPSSSATMKTADATNHADMATLSSSSSATTPARGTKRKASSATSDTKRPAKQSRTSTANNSNNNIPVELRLLQGSLGLPDDSSTAITSSSATTGGPLFPETSQHNQDPLDSERKLLADRTTLWCPNLNRFNIEFRNEAIAKLIGDKINITAGRVVRTLLRMTVGFQRTRADEQTSAVAVDRLLAAINEEDANSSSAITSSSMKQQQHPPFGNEMMLGGGASSSSATTTHMTRDTLCSYLDLLCRQQPPLVACSSDLSGGNYSVCLKKSATLLKKGLVDSIVMERFGHLSCRMFRLLQQHSQLEQKTISDYAMVPIKECREALYKMFVAGFLSVQEIPRSADRAPSRTIFLWKVQLKDLFTRLGQDILKTIWNVRKRRQHELKQADDLVKTYETRPDTLTEVQRKQLKQLREVIDRLDKATTQLDQTYMTLCDF